MQRGTQFWLPPLVGAVTYPALIILFPHAISGYRQYGSPRFAGYAALLMLLTGSIPLIVARALIAMRHDGVMRGPLRWTLRGDVRLHLPQGELRADQANIDISEDCSTLTLATKRAEWSASLPQPSVRGLSKSARAIKIQYGLVTHEARFLDALL